MIILRLNRIDNISFKFLLSLLCVFSNSLAYLQSMFFIGPMRENLAEILDSLVGAFVICSTEV